MDQADKFIAIASDFLPLLLTLGVAVPGLALAHRVMRRRWRGQADAQFRFQLIMLGLTLLAAFALIVSLPLGDTLRGQLLSLIGVLLSAAIALSSTTFIGNMMAGVMLKVVRNARPGDFISVADVSGRITEMALLHTEVQTEDRDLVTLPNLYLMTQPMKVVRSSGTIVSAEVSLGYDVSRVRVAELLQEAADRAGLVDAFVQIRSLGDFSVGYRVAGLLKEVGSLLSARSRLREAMLDSLHGAGIEIVSPNFMNTRAMMAGAQVLPPAVAAPGVDQAVAVDPAVAERVAFDKAEEAASIETMRAELDAVEARLDAERSLLSGPHRTALKVRRDRLRDEVARASEALSRQEPPQAVPPPPADAGG